MLEFQFLFNPSHLSFTFPSSLSFSSSSFLLSHFFIHISSSLQDKTSNRHGPLNQQRSTSSHSGAPRNKPTLLLPSSLLYPCHYPEGSSLHVSYLWRPLCPIGSPTHPPHLIDQRTYNSCTVTTNTATTTTITTTDQPWPTHNISTSMPQEDVASQG